MVVKSRYIAVMIVEETYDEEYLKGWEEDYGDEEDYECFYETRKKMTNGYRDDIESLLCDQVGRNSKVITISDDVWEEDG